MKRIILLCDGTWQDSLSQTHWYPSNVSRLARAIKPVSSNGVEQVVYYHPGVGSAGGLVDFFLGGTFGSGIMQQMRDLYSYLSYNYAPGDEIFFFGFSRGSYMVRALCGLVMDFGILSKAGMSEFVEVFRLYMTKKFAKNVKLQELQARLVKNGVLTLPVDGNNEKQKRITVKAIGCFDTVGSLGVPRMFTWQKDDYRFLDLKLNSNVEHAFHALALDEPRIVFQPTLWFFDPKGPHFDNYKQVWFTGNHENVGGGPMYGTAPGTNFLPPSHQVRIPNYMSEGALAWVLGKLFAQVPNVLSDGTLIWMVSNCQGLLDFDDKYLHMDIRGGHTRRDGELNYRETVLQYKEKEPVFYRGPINYNIFFILMGAIPFWPWPPRDVGGYYAWEKDYDWFFVRWLKWLRHLIFGKPADDRGLVTKEQVHVSVYNRDAISGTESRALRNVVLDPPPPSSSSADNGGDVISEKQKNGTHHDHHHHDDPASPAPVSEKCKKRIQIATYSDFEEIFWIDEGQNIHDRTKAC
ncbi:hypothetical protein V1525DRAFT_403654 [Lipomyces kononenkoae]|uniref:Uncharacterized protein n=1 Tax=Lipomyces kononenkoae TaxID=34357 RepID=A0ACC3T3H0_LIPKO